MPIGCYAAQFARGVAASLIYHAPSGLVMVFFLDCDAHRICYAAQFARGVAASLIYIAPSGLVMVFFLDCVAHRICMWPYMRGALPPRSYITPLRGWLWFLSDGRPNICISDIHGFNVANSLTMYFSPRTRQKIRCGRGNMFYSFLTRVECIICSFHPSSVKIAVALSNQCAFLMILSSVESVA